MYYVSYVEDYVSGAAWNREVTGAYSLINSLPIYDPAEQYVEYNEGVGYRMGLGGCQFGFGGRAIFVLQETLFLLDDYSGGTGLVQVTPNSLENDTAVSLTDCTINAEQYPCEGMGSLLIESIVPTASKSFGSVKALYK